MSFLDQAIAAHSQWKIKLLSSVNGGEVPDKAKSCADNQCELGKWIYGEGQKLYGSQADYVALRESHKAFHRTVGDVVDQVVGRKTEEARRNILRGDFFNQSQRVVSDILRLKSRFH